MNDSLKDLESMKHGAKLVTNKDNLSLPARSAELDRVLRYETSIQRQPTYAVNQLERLQRTRQGEHVPAPVALHVSSDQ